MSTLLRPGDNTTPVRILPLGRLLEPGRPPVNELLRARGRSARPKGARLTRTWKYARWTDGSTHLWATRRKRAGRGPGASGLVFDTVDPWQPSGRPLAYESIRVRITGARDPVDLDNAQPNQTALVTWQIRNVGTATWRRTGTDPLRLGTSDDRDHPGRLATPNWLNSARPAAPAEPVISPGQSATFAFQIRTPTASGPFDEAYQPLVENGQWIDGPGLVIRGRVTL